MTTEAYIQVPGAEVPLLADGPLQWEQAKGMAPYQTIFNTLPAFKGTLDGASGKPVTLVMKTGNKEIKFEKLYILDFPAPIHPKHLSFVVSDCRWMWEWSWIISRYNIKRNIGFKRVEAPNLELAKVRDDIYFKKFSLFDPAAKFPENKWTPQQALTDVLERILKNEEDWSGVTREVHFSNALTHKLKEIPLEDMEIDDKGDVALTRLVSRLPMANLYLKNNGDIQFYNQMSGRDEGEFGKLGPAVFGTGTVKPVQNYNVRPSKLHVLFTKEIEVRFDAQDEPETTVGNTDPSEVPEMLAPNQKAMIHLLEPVLPIPDYKLKVTVQRDGDKAEEKVTLPNGSWITFHQALNAWADPENLDEADGAEEVKVWPFMPADANGEQINIDHPFIRKGMVPWLNLWSGIVAAGERFPSALWGSRLLAIPMHWRRTFRIPADWIDGSLSIIANRIGIVDQETGTRSPSMVWSNYTVVNSQRNIFKGIDMSGNMNNNGNAPFAYLKFYGYPNAQTVYDGGAVNEFKIHQEHDFTMGITDERTKSSPATLQIVDGDQGIIRINWLNDPFMLMDQTIPGHIAEEGLYDGIEAFPPPSGPGIQEVGYLGQNVKYWAEREGISRGWNWVESEVNRVTRFTRDHRMATIFTMVPAGPNTMDQLYRITVEPKDVQPLLPDAVHAGLNDARGPEMFVRVGPGTVTAKFAWKDTKEHAESVRNTFGIKWAERNPMTHPEGWEGIDESARERELTDETLINKGDMGKTFEVAESSLAFRGPSLDAVALATAASIYAAKADKLSGSVDGVINPDVNIDGFIGTIMHQIDQRGGGFTNIQLTEPIGDIDIFSLLDESSRNLIMKLVQQPKK